MQEIFNSLGIDWVKLITHLVSFVIALWLLKKFAWGPILNLLDERRNKIAGEFQEIEKGKDDVESLKSEYESKLDEIDNERRATIVKAVEEGKSVAADIRATAQNEARELTEKTKQDLEREVAKAKVQLRSDMVTMTIAAAEKVIRERLDDNKHRELIDRFITDLEKA